MKRMLPLALFLAIGACAGESPTTADGSCTLGVHANDRAYFPVETLAAEATVSAEAHISIVRFDPTCRDEGQTYQPVNGESNFLPVGTPLHTIEGFDPLERLTYWDSEAPGWRMLAVQQNPCEGKKQGMGKLGPPCG